MGKTAIFLLLLLLVWNGGTFFCYGADKWRAKRGLWRIPERVLLGMSLGLGGIGGLLAMTLFRHKIRKTRFWVLNLLGALLAAGAAVGLTVLFPSL